MKTGTAPVLVGSLLLSAFSRRASCYSKLLNHLAQVISLLSKGCLLVSDESTSHPCSQNCCTTASLLGNRSSVRLPFAIPPVSLVHCIYCTRYVLFCSVPFLWLRLSPLPDFFGSNTRFRFSTVLLLNLKNRSVSHSMLFFFSQVPLVQKPCFKLLESNVPSYVNKRIVIFAEPRSSFTSLTS